jgi:hypothetical protein
MEEFESFLPPILLSSILSTRDFSTVIEVSLSMISAMALRSGVPVASMILSSWVKFEVPWKIGCYK